MINIKRVIKNRELRMKIAGLLAFVPSKIYLKLVYKNLTGKTLNLKNPRGFNEKENWLKLYDKHKEYTQLVDKIGVREYIKEKLGEEYLIPMLGKWKRFEDVPFDQLPDKFVLKCNHDSGSVNLVTDKEKIDKSTWKKFYNKRLKRNSFYPGREYPYKKIKPYIIAEQLMEAKDGKGIRDYKFFCFNGKPEIMFIATERATDVKFDFFDMEFNHLDIYNLHENSDKQIEKPACFEEMIEICKKLTQGMKFVRLDLYEIEGKVYFGEFTFFHGGGFAIFYPDEWEQKLGDLIDITQ